MIALIATLATGFALLLFVFLRNGWRRAMEDDETAVKWRRIRLFQPKPH